MWVGHNVCVRALCMHIYVCGGGVGGHLSGLHYFLSFLCGNDADI